MQFGEKNSSQMKNSHHQTVFVNTPESERIFPTTVGNFTVQNPYSRLEGCLACLSDFAARITLSSTRLTNCLYRIT